MSTRTHLMNIAMAAAALASTTSMTACDTEGEPSWDAETLDLSDVEFRCSLIGGCADGEKANDNFVGAKPDYMFWYMPLEPGAHPNIELLKVKTTKCYDRVGTLVPGDFEALTPTLWVDSLGAFAPFQVRDVTDPSIVCEAYGQALVDSLWFLDGTLADAQGQLDDVVIRLKIADVQTDSDGRTLMKWMTDHTYLSSDGSANGAFSPTCDDDPNGGGLGFHAMLYDELEVDESDNTFGTTPNVAYIACLSGTIGKALTLWDYDQTNTVTQQVASNAAMAGYCGDGVSYTQSGTMIDLWNIHGNPGDPDDDEPLTGAGDDFALEAVWNANNEAMCIGTTRLAANQPDWTAVGAGFPCSGNGQTWLLPECTPQDLADPAAVLATYTYVGQ